MHPNFLIFGLKLIITRDIIGEIDFWDIFQWRQRRLNFYTSVLFYTDHAKLFGSDDFTITSPNVLKTRFLSYFCGVATTKPKIVALPVIRSTPNFQELFVSKLNSTSGKMEKFLQSNW